MKLVAIVLNAVCGLLIVASWKVVGLVEAIFLLWWHMSEILTLNKKRYVK